MMGTGREPGGVGMAETLLFLWAGLGLFGAPGEGASQDGSSHGLCPVQPGPEEYGGCRGDQTPTLAKGEYGIPG